MNTPQIIKFPFQISQVLVSKYVQQILQKIQQANFQLKHFMFGAHSTNDNNFCEALQESSLKSLQEKFVVGIFDISTFL